jgi:hypothetical protein
MIKLTIIDKRKHKESEQATTFLTGGYGGKFFSLPNSQVKKKYKSFVDLNDTHKEEATTYLITQWIYNKIAYELSLMNKSNYKIECLV